MEWTNYLFDHEHKLFTVKHPKNTFVIDYSNGYPVKLTTNVKRDTPWSDIFKGKYDYANDGTPEYLNVNGEKYTYIDYKYAHDVLGYVFIKHSGLAISRWKSKFEKNSEDLFKRVS